MMIIAIKIHTPTDSAIEDTTYPIEKNNITTSSIIASMNQNASIQSIAYYVDNAPYRE